MKSETLMEVLGGKLDANEDGSYTVTFPDGSTTSFGRTFNFDRYQATRVFCNEMEFYFDRQEMK